MHVRTNVCRFLIQQLMCFQCAMNGGNKILAAHFAFLAHRSGVPISRLAEVADEDAMGGGASAAEDAAMAFAHATRYTLPPLPPPRCPLERFASVLKDAAKTRHSSLS